jgi:hypothetical protein
MEKGVGNVLFGEFFQVILGVSVKERKLGSVGLRTSKGTSLRRSFSKRDQLMGRLKLEVMVIVS